LSLIITEGADRGAVPGPGGQDQPGDCCGQAPHRGGKSGRGAGEAASPAGSIGLNCITLLAVKPIKHKGPMGNTVVYYQVSVDSMGLV